MDFREQVYITTVADCKSITKAATQLFVSQPSLSHLISKVESDMGVKLFDRNTYPISLTYAGERYVDTARKILMLNDNLIREFMDISRGEKGRIKIGMPTERVGYMLPKILPVFKEAYPGIEVSTFEGKSEFLIEALIKGQINLIIFPSTNYNPELVSELIYKEELYLVVNDKLMEQYNCIETGNFITDLARFGDCPFVLLNKGHSIRNAVEILFKRKNIAPKVVMETHSTINALSLAMTGVGATIVPARSIEMIRELKGYKIYSLSEVPYCWDVRVFYRKDTYLDNTEKKFIEIAREIFKRREK